MKAAITGALGKRRIGFIRWLMERLEDPRAARRIPPPLMTRRLRAKEERLFAALGGAMSFQILRTAHEIGIFDLLRARPGLRREEIAEALGLDVHPVAILLLGLVPLGLVCRIGEDHFNDPWIEDVVADLKPILDYFHHVINPAMAHLEASVRENRPVGLHRIFGEDVTSFYAALGRREEVNRYFQEAMQADTRLNRDRVAAGFFAGSQRLLDVGGSTGELAIAIARYHPSIRITVFDFPEVADRARLRFAAEGLADRLDACAGDARTGELPAGYDAVLFAHFLDIFSPGDVDRMLGSAHAALPRGGSIYVFGSVLDDDEQGPLTHGVLSSYFLCLAGGEGRFHTAKRTARAMRDAGFTRIKTTRLPRSEVVLEGLKGDGGA